MKKVKVESKFGKAYVLPDKEYKKQVLNNIISDLEEHANYLLMQSKKCNELISNMEA